jgi:putative transposase
MSRKPTARRVRSHYEFIKAHRRKHSVQAMCRLLGVAPSGYYAWLAQPVSDRAQEDARLLRLIRASFTASQGIYGAPRVFLDLREAGEGCSKHRVARLMREHQLGALHGYRMRRWSVTFGRGRGGSTWPSYGSVLAQDRGLVSGPTIHRELVLDARLMAVRRQRPRGTLPTTSTASTTPPDATVTSAASAQSNSRQH